MRSSRYRLLIVESAVLARGLAALAMPGLEVLSTGGYAWLPQLQPDSSGRPMLKARANPEPRQLAFRKALRSKSGLAAEIIIATDPDPSGAFIASCIAKFLKYDGRLRRGYLPRLSLAALQQLIETAAPLSKETQNDVSSEFLRRYFLMRQHLRSDALRQLSQLGFTLPPECDVIALMLALAHLQTKTTHHFSVSSAKGDGIITHLQSLQPVPISDQPAQLSPIPSPTQSVFPPLAQPLSTAFLGEFEPSALGLATYDTLQQQLNNLFMVQPETQAAAISYPRTAACAWTRESWEQLSAGFMRVENISAEKLRPNALRQIHVLKAGAGHQALHITDFTKTPYRMRRFLKPPALALYTRLYQATRDALSYPDALPAERMLQDAAGNRYFVNDSATARSRVEGIVSLKPFVPLSGLLQSLLDSGWVKASALGRTADALCAAPWLRFHAKPRPHLQLNQPPAELLQLARHIKQQAGEMPEMLHHHNK